MSTAVLVDKIFNPELRKKADAIVAKYETRRASILEILRLLQEEKSFISLEAQEAVGQYLEIAAVDVREVMTFYTLFYDKPKAKTRFHICQTLSCNLMGGEEIIQHLESKLGVKAGSMTLDGKFSIHRVECLGACEHAPMMQLNDTEYIPRLTKEKVDEIVKKSK